MPKLDPERFIPIDATTTDEFQKTKEAEIEKQSKLGYRFVDTRVTKEGMMLYFVPRAVISSGAAKNRIKKPSPERTPPRKQRR